MLKRLINPVKNSNYLVGFILVALATLVPFFGNAQNGEELFKTHCSTCHKISTSKFVGPGLLDVTKRRSTEWLMSWTKNSQEFIASGDSTAVAIFAEFNSSAMPPFDFLGDSAISAIYEYIETGGVETQVVAEADQSVQQEAATDVIDEPVAPASDPGGSIIYWFIIVVVVLLAWMFYSIYKSVHRAMDENGYLEYKDYNKNYLTTFLAVAGGTGFVIFLLKEALAVNSPGFINLMFGGLPYIAIAVFFIGTIYRYRTNGFKVSSLSSQFLEGRQLFFGSQPFHWGMLVLFLGHLVAFLVPKAILLWNGHPVRLMILEISSLVFALSALIGLILLIKRRFSNSRIMVVTNQMDTLVYVILLVQIISGISIALFARWGSSWFATSLTPYLRSIFTFDPEIGVASAMPWFAQIHIISAFFIVAIIPFTRFMHFLVVPFAYIWRKYQVVYWNWNRKSIRKSTAHTYGKLPRNH